MAATIKRFRVIIAILLCITFIFAFPMTAGAATKKAVYVQTGIVSTSYLEDEAKTYTYKFTYDKNGFVTKESYKDEDGWTAKITFKYGKNNIAKQRTDKFYYNGDHKSTFKSKLTFNKAGYFTGIKEYHPDGFISFAKKVTLNKKNLPAKVRDYGENEKLTEVRKYKYNSDDKRSVRKG